MNVDDLFKEKDSQTQYSGPRDHFFSGKYFKN